MRGELGLNTVLVPTGFDLREAIRVGDYSLLDKKSIKPLDRLSGARFHQ